jgi:hypothetical protein
VPTEENSIKTIIYKVNEVIFALQEYQYGAGRTAMRLNGALVLYANDIYNMLDSRFGFISASQENSMLNPQELFNVIQEQVSQILPDATKSAQEDMASHIKLLVSGVISKLDLVSRDEFDAQQAVLERTRSRLEQLEKDFADLENRFDSNKD